VSPVTTSKNFQEFQPLRECLVENLETAFIFGDSDPRWPIGPGAQSALGLQHSLNIVAKNWDLSPATITVLSDRYLAFYLAIMGSANATGTSSIGHSPIERKEILAIVEALSNSSEISAAEKRFSVGIDGIFNYGLESGELNIIQLRNGETGISQQDLPPGGLVIDATSAVPSNLMKFKIDSLPWHAIVLDASSWNGPRGVYYLAINPKYAWRNPLPTLDTALPQFGANYALTLLSTLALEDFMNWDQKAIEAANKSIREIVSSLPDVDIAGEETGDRLSLSFLYVQSEELQRALWSDGFLVDSGSACSSSALEPSHVLTRMGLLSHGNVRLRFTPENLGSASDLAHLLVRHVDRLRA
jgi:cysteine sulfinate desulfinase/cysteine desulfurase-like protein